MSNKTAIAAAVKAALRGESAFVFASSTEGQQELQSTKAVLAHAYSAFGCKSCKTSMYALASTSPFCVTCGSSDVEVTAKEVKPKASALASMVSLQCSSCDHVTSVPHAVASTILTSKKQPIHCSCCGTALVMAQADALAPAAEEPTLLKDAGTSDSKSGDNPEKPEIKVTSEGDEGMPPISDDLTDAEDDDINLADLNADMLDDADADMDEEAEEGMEGSSTLVRPDTPEIGQSELGAPEATLELEPFVLEEEPTLITEEVVGDGSPYGDGDELSLSPDVADTVVINDETGDPLVDALEVDDTEMALAFVTANKRVVAMKGHITVASFNKDPSLVARPDALAGAAFAAVRASGLRKGLTEVGFTLTRVPVVSKSTVEAKVSAVQASVKKQAEADRKIFAETYALASAGLNRGNWKGYSNPLRAAMETELARAGVASPKRVAAAVFESAGLDYARTLLDVTARLSKLTAANRKELAEMLNLTAAAFDESESEEEDLDVSVDTSPVEARFEQPALLRAPVKASAAASGQSSVTASEILAGKGLPQFTSQY